MTNYSNLCKYTGKDEESPYFRIVLAKIGGNFIKEYPDYKVASINVPWNQFFIGQNYCRCLSALH